MPKRILVCYSSQTNTAERLAEDFARELNACFKRGGTCEVRNIRDVRVDDLKNWDLVCFFISSYGDGEQCDDGLDFFASVKALEDMYFEKLGYPPFTLFGLGSSLYDLYQGASVDFYKELTRCSLHSLGKFGKGDDGIGTLIDDYDEWMFDLLPLISDFLEIPFSDTSEEYHAAFSTIDLPLKTCPGPYRDSVKPPFHVDKPYLAQIHEIRELSGETGAKMVIHAGIDLDDSKLHYTTGDHIGIYPANSDQDVELFLNTFGLYERRNQIIKVIPTDRMSTKLFFPNPTTYWQLSKYFLEINSCLNRKMVRTIGKAFTGPINRVKLLELTKDRGTFMKKVTSNHDTITTFLRGFDTDWSCVPFSFLLESLGPLRPRYYSISSSSLKQPTVVDITVSLVIEGNFQGVFSRNVMEVYQADNHPKLPIFLEQTKFRLPYDTRKPILMVCAGVGVAPFRGFVQERCEQRQRKPSASFGKMYLYYGLRHLKKDLLYRDEWKEYEDILGPEGLELKFAESRNGGKKYVQDLLKEDTQLIGDLIIKQGCYIYVCGASNTMNKGVSKELIDILKTFKGDIKQADRYLRYQKVVGKYKEDVW
ncbi:DEKNAAC104798 [Brettanomyces naardenensis]|uniref:DEKNAAC104798 n=1 Tax=Brettanomyces naardenensis TaxID=13370 RepID=A0A448YSB8_BRENA|nr:DEKNAAC104798 [Brettanomyces naardenensis]